MPRPKKIKSGVDLSSLAEAWHAPYVARREVEKFSGGMIRSRTLANADSLKIGVPGRFTVGKNVVYPTENLIRWLEERAKA